MSDDQVGSAHVVRLSDVKVERVSWLWQDRIPFGKLTVLEGHPGTGKSTFTIELAACITTGTTLPGGPQHPPSDVLVLTAEDGVADTVRPRLEAARGDATRVHVVEGIVDEDGGLGFPGLPDDISAIAAAIEDAAARLVILDPLTAYLGGAVNSYKDHDVRRALAPLAKVAEQTGAAVVVVRHLTKQTGGQAITAGGGSIGIIGAARSGLLVARDPDDPDRRVLAVSKSNLAKLADSLSFRLEDTDGYARVRWEGTSAHSADRLVAVPSDPEEKSALDEARELLADWLRDGPMLQKEVQRLAREAGVSEKTLRRAKQAGGVESVRVGGSRGAFYWQLPTAGTGSPIHGHLGHLCVKQGITDSPGNDLKGGQPPMATFDSDAGGHLSEPAALRCTDPLCEGTLWRRRSGVTRCRVCIPDSPRDPYVGPALEGQAA